MAGDIGAGEATLAAKVASGASAGVAWGSFVTLLLLIPAAFGTLLSPFAKKANAAISEKIATIQPSQTTTRKTSSSKADREYSRRMAELNAQREEQELRERLASLARKKTKSRSNGARVTTV